MAEKPNFVLVPDTQAREAPPSVGPRPVGKALAPWLATVRRLSGVRALVARAGGLLAAERTRDGGASEPVPWSGRPRLVFGFDATASREPAWSAARQVTDALVRALPGELDMALAVHGGGRLHTVTGFTADANRLRDRAAAVSCIAGPTRMLPILSFALASPGVRVVTYIGDVFEERPGHAQRLADEMGRRGIRLIVLHDVADWMARRDGEVFLGLARRTGGCLLPFDARAPGRLRELLAAVAVYAVGGEALLEAKRGEMAAAGLLLEHLRGEG